LADASATGPTASAGRKVSAPTIEDHEATSRPMNSGPLVGKDPAEAGAVFLAARLPAMASAGMMSRKRPIQHRHAEWAL
jgi:hypothetical protein